MHDISLFLRVLASRVYTAEVQGVPVRDVSDVAAWLRTLAERAEQVSTMEELFREE